MLGIKAELNKNQYQNEHKKQVRYCGGNVVKREGFRVFFKER